MVVFDRLAVGEPVERGVSVRLLEGVLVVVWVLEGVLVVVWLLEGALEGDDD